MERRFLDLQRLNGLEKAVGETINFDRIVRGVYEVTAREVYGASETPDVAIFAYGSPGRIEMVGGDSDADIFFIEKAKTEKSKKLKYLLKTRLKPFDFAKIDMPNWGAFDELKIYLEKSLVEGNQVLETRYLIGDIQVEEDIFLLKQKFDSVERGLKNIIFNRLYFNQYFKQRTKQGAPNIKYCNGGSREFLFVYWHDRLDRFLFGDKMDNSYRPKVETGLSRLFEQRIITEREFNDASEAVNFMIALRGDVLKLNKNTNNRGLTFLDEETVERLHIRGYPESSKTKKLFDRYRRSMENVANIIWEETIKKATKIRGKHWEEQFRKAYEIPTSVEERAKISSDDPLLRIALLWGASNSGQKDLFDYLAGKYRDTEDWATIGSIVCSPYCRHDILKHFGNGQAKQKGYGYLLRVIARNPNVDKETLKSIAYDSALEKRYTEVAKAALNGGHAEANRQI
jgi:hypothetical protein